MARVVDSAPTQHFDQSQTSKVVNTGDQDFAQFLHKFRFVMVVLIGLVMMLWGGWSWWSSDQAFRADRDAANQAREAARQLNDQAP